MGSEGGVALQQRLRSKAKSRVARSFSSEQLHAAFNIFAFKRWLSPVHATEILLVSRP